MNESLAYYERIQPLTGALIFAVIIATFALILFWDKIKPVISKLTFNIF